MLSQPLDHHLAGTRLCISHCENPTSQSAKPAVPAEYLSQLEKALNAAFGSFHPDMVLYNAVRAPAAQ